MQKGLVTKETGANARLDGHLDAKRMPFFCGLLLPPGTCSVDNSGGLDIHDPCRPHASLPKTLPIQVQTDRSLGPS